ncbi:hypothetical protein HMPREF0240_01027 [Clostridium sp. D5]|nr:hypothetical protein HMPREF0240_01027 [Clostridium sp. D5]
MAKHNTSAYRALPVKSYITDSPYRHPVFHSIIRPLDQGIHYAPICIKHISTILSTNPSPCQHEPVVICRNMTNYDKYVRSLTPVPPPPSPPLPSKSPPLSFILPQGCVQPEKIGMLRCCPVRLMLIPEALSVLRSAYCEKAAFYGG